MGKGQANTIEWQELPWQDVEIFHFSTLSKPYFWLEKGTIECLHSAAQEFPEELIGVIQRRAQKAYDLWMFHVLLVLIFLTVRVRKLQVMSSLYAKDWTAYLKACQHLLR